MFVFVFGLEGRGYLVFLLYRPLHLPLPLPFLARPRPRSRPRPLLRSQGQAQQMIMLGDVRVEEWLLVYPLCHVHPRNEERAHRHTPKRGIHHPYPFRLRRPLRPGSVRARGSERGGGGLVLIHVSLHPPIPTLVLVHGFVRAGQSFELVGCPSRGWCKAGTAGTAGTAGWAVERQDVHQQNRNPTLLPPSPKALRYPGACPSLSQCPSPSLANRRTVPAWASARRLSQTCPHGYFPAYPPPMLERETISAPRPPAPSLRG